MKIVGFALLGSATANLFIFWKQWRDDDIELYDTIYRTLFLLSLAYLYLIGADQ